MRTALTIDDHLLAEARRRPLAERRSLGDVVDDALRAMFARLPAVGGPRIVLPEDGDPSGRPLVDIDDRGALAEALGDNTWPRQDTWAQPAAAFCGTDLSDSGPAAQSGG